MRPRALAGIARGVALALAAPAALYLAAALVLGLWPVHRDFRHTPAADGGVQIYLRTNGVHAEFVLPAFAPYDWGAEFPAAALIDPARVPSAAPYRWLAFGWGDRDFFIVTRTWRDLRPAAAWVALSGSGRGAMHVEYVARPADYPGQRIAVSAAQYAALVEYLRDSFARDAHGAVQRIDAPGFFATDAFYEAVDVYNAFFTCNEWVRRGLARAGIRTSVWSPFDAALFWQLRRAGPAPEP